MALSLKTVEEETQIMQWNTYKLKILTFKKNFVKSTNINEVLLARSFCYYVMKYLWNIVDSKNIFKLRSCSLEKISLDIESIKLAKEIAEKVSELSTIECGYYIGVIYTLLLPKEYKSSLGIYYTPPVLAERLLDMLASEGTSWSEDKILDPACGGGAFLIQVTNRILADYKIKRLSAEKKLHHIESHILGIEIDKFAGWLTQVLLDVTTYQEAVISGRRLKNVVKITNTLDFALINRNKYDLIVGNPPYGRVTLDPDTRNAYSRSLFGHANMYGIFIDAALRMKSPNGLIGFVTPTSFLGGEYFKNLRDLLIKEAPPIAINFISSRSGVFEEVLQEACLSVFGDNKSKEVSIHNIDIDDSSYKLNKVGFFKLNFNSTPWIIPRHNSEVNIINCIKDLKTTIKDYGYRVSTGPLVWNRHKEQLRTKSEANVHPIIWSEAIMEGNFSIDYKYRENKYIKLKENQDFLLCKQSVVLVQRTTSKEQNRRLLAAVMPEEFIHKWDGVVVENHVNMVFPVGDTKMTLEALTVILNSKIVDRIFRCISGSVAVSVSELHSLPLPSCEKVKEIDNLVENFKNKKITIEDLTLKVENVLQKAYGVEV